MSLKLKILKATDKLFTQSVTIHKRIEYVDRFGENLGIQTTDYDVTKSLFVNQEGRYEATQNGKYDNQTGYLLINKFDCEQYGFFVNDKIIFDANDFVSFSGDKYEILGIELVGSDFQSVAINDYVLVKFYLKKIINGV